MRYLLPQLRHPPNVFFATVDAALATDFNIPLVVFTEPATLLVACCPVGYETFLALPL